mgnify:CR=1 FL=1
MTDRRRLSNSFVLRIWWEEDDHLIWRGWVQHAATGETCYFQHLSDLLTFVETQTGSLAIAPAAETDEVGNGGETR